jgi:membrane-associated phospholipid phosphatase
MRPARCLALALALPVCASADVDAERRAGDVLSFALPVATLGVELARGDRAGARQFAGSFVVTLAATEALKRLTGIERPDGSNTLSFPSGHASRAFAAATYVHRRHGFAEARALYGLATYVGYTRVVAERHRWADVAGSAVVAATSSWWIVEPKSRGLGVAVGPGSVWVQWSMPLH